MIFRSKFDSFFIVFMSITILIIAGVMWIPLFFGTDATESDVMIVSILFVAIVGYLLWSIFSVQYVFHDEYLLLKSGPFRTKIPYEELTAVSSTSDIFFGYRLLTSRDGLELFYKKALLGSVKISPKEKEAFLAELEKRCPNANINI